MEYLDPHHPFKWRHFQGEIILLCVRWYLRYSLSYRDLEEMMLERGLSVDHTTIYRWVQAYAPELDRRVRPHLKQINDSWRVDETYVKVKGQWMYLYRAVDSTGATIDFFLSERRSRLSAHTFLLKALGDDHTVQPRVITTDQNPIYTKVIKKLIRQKFLQQTCMHRHSRYLNNLVEQDHRFIKRLVKPCLGFTRYLTAWNTIRGYEAMHMLQKGQVLGVGRGNVLQLRRFMTGVFGLAS
jgi:transposase-like protein